jgi:hypothetical protein
LLRELLEEDAWNTYNLARVSSRFREWDSAA